ncbi:mitochondrial ribosomal protein S34 [Brevipalpus obovatus]|uniref:mitochondrial ribosomal protein S34 n=1 Tax=Brevipalpus obovatus TaxID=246614 RepID=UPI003D9EA337
MAIIYVGKTSRLYGKTVFEILANLRHFGKGRILERISLTQKYGKKSFYVVKDPRPQMDKELVHGYLYCDFYYKEQRVPGLTELLTYRHDYRLIPKHLEEEYLEIIQKAPILGEETPKKVLPRYYSLPPVMAEVLNRRNFLRPPCLYIKGLTKESYGYDSESLIKKEIPYVYKFNQLEELLMRVAEEGEKIEPPKPRITCERLMPKEDTQ